MLRDHSSSVLALKTSQSFFTLVNSALLLTTCSVIQLSSNLFYIIHTNDSVQVVRSLEAPGLVFTGKNALAFPKYGEED